MNDTHSLEAEDMTPIELVRHANFSLQKLGLSPQVERDKFAAQIAGLCDEQCYAALEFGDTDAFRAYVRAGRFIKKFTDRYLHGSNFEIPGTQE